MKEASPVAGKLILLASNKRAVNNNKDQRQTVLQKTECVTASEAPPKKKKPPSKPFTLESPDLFEASTAGANREVSMLFTKFAEVIRERAAVDVSQMKKIEGILIEAQNLQCHLREKKNHLRHSLGSISDKLLG